MVAAQTAAALLGHLLLGHAVFHEFKVVLAPVGLPLGQVDAAGGLLETEGSRGDLQIGGDVRVAAQVLVDTGGGHLAGFNGQDDGGRTGDTVAAGEDPLHAGDAAVGTGHQGAPLGRDPRLDEGIGVHPLAHGHEDHIAGEELFGLVGVTGGGAAALDLANDLGLDHQTGDLARPVGLHPDGGLQGEDLTALGHGALHLFGQGGHVGDAAAVDALDGLGPQTDGGAGGVHGHIAAAYDDHVFAGEVGLGLADGGVQQLNGGQHPVGLLAGDAQGLVEGGADGQVDAVVVLAELFQGHIGAYGTVELDLHAGGEDAVNVPLQIGAGQTVAGDAVAEHTAQLGFLLEDGAFMTHQGEEVGGGQAGGAAAHDGDALAGGGGAGRGGHVPGVVHGKALDAPDVQGGVHDGPAAVGLAGVLTDETTDRGEGVVLPDEANGVVVALLAHQGNVAGNVHMGRAQLHAGDALEVGGAAAVGGVGHVVVVEGHVAVQDHLGGLEADGAVGAVYDGLGGAEDDLQISLGALACQQLVQQVGQTVQTDAAGHAFAAALGQAKFQKGTGQLHRAVAAGGGGNAPLHVGVQVIHRALGVLPGGDTKPAQIDSLPSCVGCICFRIPGTKKGLPGCRTEADPIPVVFW